MRTNDRDQPKPEPGDHQNVMMDTIDSNLDLSGLATDDLTQQNNNCHPECCADGESKGLEVRTHKFDRARNRVQFIGSLLRRYRICQALFLALIVAALAGLVWWLEWSDSVWLWRAFNGGKGPTQNDLNRSKWEKSRKVLFQFALAKSRERLLASGQPIPLPPNQGVRGVAVIFSTYAGMVLPRIWEAWLQDAYDWIHAENLEDASVPPNQSKILRPFLHYFWGFDSSYIADCAPPHLKDATMKQVGRGLYRTLQLNYDFMFTTAFNECPDCYFFVTMSHNSIPLKRFKDWYTDLQSDARSRVTLFTTVFNPAFPGAKASSWKTLIRPHVEVLVHHKIAYGTFEDKALRRIHPWTEEYYPMYLLSQYMGENCFREIRAAYLDEGNIHGYPKCSRTACSFPEEQFECWHKPCHGEHDPEHRSSPFAYTSIEESWLYKLLNDHDSFFARKFGAETVVTYASGGTIPLEEYLQDGLGLKLVWSQKRDCEIPASFRDLGNYAKVTDVEKALRATCLPGLKPEYRNKSCTELGMGMGINPPKLH